MLADLNERFPCEGLKVLVTEVTRMKDGLVCVAGINLSTGKMVRPLQPTGNNWEQGDWVDEGYLVVGNVVCLTPLCTPARPLPHGNEDLFIKSVDKVWKTSKAELFAASQKASHPGRIQDLIAELQERKYVVAGTDCPSLFCVVVRKNTIRLSDKYDKMQLSFPDGQDWFNLPITDLNAKDLESATAGIAYLQKQIDAATSHIAIRLGFAREWDGPSHEYDPKRCYLQVNGIIGN